MAQATEHRLEVTKTSERELLITRVFDAPREQVWQCFSDPKLLAQWWGRGNKLDVERFEFEKGGHWRFVEHSDGETHGFEGRFREIVPMERISWTFEWDGMPGHPSIDDISFEDFGDGRTRVVNTSMFFTAEERDGMIESGMEGGLAESYAALDRLLASMK
jgi:uncharacterized protein YndB with AHSA1/START domain